MDFLGFALPQRNRMTVTEKLEWLEWLSVRMRQLLSNFEQQITQTEQQPVNFFCDGVELLQNMAEHRQGLKTLLRLLEEQRQLMASLKQAAGNASVELKLPEMQAQMNEINSLVAQIRQLQSRLVEMRLQQMTELLGQMLMAELQVLQERRKTFIRYSPHPLEELSLLALDCGEDVLMNMKTIFNNLPGLMMERISKLHPRWQRLPLVGLLMTPQTNHLRLDLRGLPGPGETEVPLGTKEQVIGILGQAVTICGGSLRSLELELGGSTAHPDPQMGAVRTLISCTTKLHNLSLSMGPVCHEDYMSYAAFTVASKNPELESLRLCLSLHPSGLILLTRGCPRLTSLSLPLLKRSGATEYLTEAVRALPHLEELEAPCRDEALIEVARTRDPLAPTLPLTGIFKLPSQMPPPSPQDVARVFTTFPRLDALGVTDALAGTAAEGLQEVQHGITALEVDLVAPRAPALPRSLLAVLGPSLTRLHMQCRVGRVDIDLAMVGSECPLLEDVGLEAQRFVAGQQFPIQEFFFAQLRLLKLHKPNSLGGEVRLPNPLMFRLLASPHLTDVSLKMIALTDQVVTDLTSAAAQDPRGPLSSLQSLQYQPKLASPFEAASLAAHAPRLTRVVLFYSQEEGEGEHCRLQAKFLAASLSHVSCSTQALIDLVLAEDDDDDADESDHGEEMEEQQHDHEDDDDGEELEYVDADEVGDVED